MSDAIQGTFQIGGIRIGPGSTLDIVEPELAAEFHRGSGSRGEVVLDALDSSFLGQPADVSLFFTRGVLRAIEVRVISENEPIGWGSVDYDAEERLKARHDALLVEVLPEGTGALQWGNVESLIDRERRAAIWIEYENPFP